MRRVQVEGEQLLRIGAGAARAAHTFGDGQLDVEPAIGGPAVPLASTSDHCLGGVQNLHVALGAANVLLPR